MNNLYFLLEVYNRSFLATIPGLITNSSYTYTKKQYFWHQNPTAKPSFRSALVYAIPTSWTPAFYSSICSGPTLSRTKTSHQAPIQVPASKGTPCPGHTPDPAHPTAPAQIGLPLGFPVHRDHTSQHKCSAHQ